MSKEIGRIGQRRYGGVIYEEFLPELRGSRGVEIYREMSENDDVVGAILYAIEMLVRQTDWIVEPGGGTAKDREAAEFVQSCMDDMQSTWVDKAFVEGLGKFNDLIAQHFHGVKTQENILMKGRSRTECSYIKNLFDQFIEGPAIENREIEELGAKYEEFYKAMGGLNDDVAAKRKVEDSVMGVAIEAEMQGFIYGFKVFEILLNRELATA